MNEQQLADLFSEQIDRMIQGEADIEAPAVEELADLLDLGQEISQMQFQASSAAQASFQSLLASWFGSMNGGSPMTILGLSKAWFISLVITTVVIISGAGLIAVITTTVLIVGAGGPIVGIPATPTATGEVTGTPDSTPDTPMPDDDDDNATSTTTVTPEPSGTITITPVPSGTMTITPVPSGTVTITPEPTGTVTVTPTGDPPTIIFINNISIVQLCQGIYTSQQTISNYGGLPVADAALAWEVIEGQDLVDNVTIGSDALELLTGDDDSSPAGSGGINQSNNEDPSIPQDNYANFSQISIEQNVDLNVKVKVNDDWWNQPDGTQVKVKLSVKNKIEINYSDPDGDDDKGHGNDQDGHDEDNPGKKKKKKGNGPNKQGPSQIITIVKQGAQWVTLSGVAHQYSDQSLLVDGNIVAINNCTGLPPTLPPGSDVQVTGILLPDGTFIAINITIINITIINGNFDSGVPSGDSGGSKGGSKGGGRKGGSKGGSGGSKGGSKGGS